MDVDVPMNPTESSLAPVPNTPSAVSAASALGTVTTTTPPPLVTSSLLNSASPPQTSNTAGETTTITITIPENADGDVRVPATTPPTEKPKPKSKARKEHRSPSPASLPPPPPPMLTVRLNIPLGGADDYTVSILNLAKETGQRQPTPLRVRRDSISGSDDDDEGDEENDGGAKPTATIPKPDGTAEAKPRPKKRKKRVDPDAEYYDLNDPFIDDSDLGIDAPTHFAQTKHTGFYVSSGKVALVEDVPAPKPPAKKKRNVMPLATGLPMFAIKKLLSNKNSSTLPSNGRSVSTPSANGHSHHDASDAAGPSNQANGEPPKSAGMGTRDSPIALLDDDDSEAASKRLKLASGAGIGTSNGVSRQGSPMSVDGGSKKRKRPDEPRFHPTLEAALVPLRAAIAAEKFENKSKFPTQLKPLLVTAAVKAIEVDQYDDHFFSYLPEIFPYNRFTMTKLTKRLVYAKHQDILESREVPILMKLKELVEEGYPLAQQQHADAMLAWEEKQEKKRIAKGEADATGSTNPSPAPAGEEGGKKEREDKPPAKRYRLTDDMRGCIWALVSNNNEQAALAKVMNDYNIGLPAPSEQSFRKPLYQKILGVFPADWMATSHISREVSNMKKKVQVYNAEQEQQEQEQDEDEDE